jgi:hypothetical protein
MSTTDHPPTQKKTKTKLEQNGLLSTLIHDKGIMSELLGKEIERERDIEHLLCYFSPL